MLIRLKELNSDEAFISGSLIKTLFPSVCVLEGFNVRLSNWMSTQLKQKINFLTCREATSLMLWDNKVSDMLVHRSHRSGWYFLHSHVLANKNNVMWSKSNVSCWHLCLMYKVIVRVHTFHHIPISDKNMNVNSSRKMLLKYNVAWRTQIYQLQVFTLKQFIFFADTFSHV